MNDPQHHTRLADALLRAADAFDDALASCTSLHEEFTRLAESTRSRVEDTLSDELRHRRIQVATLAGSGLADLIRADAAAADARFADVDTTGTRLPPTPPHPDPFEVADWWAYLDEEDRRLVETRRTAWCGRTDGLPAEVRYRTNHANLVEEIHSRTSGIAFERANGDGEVAAAVALEADDRETRDLRGLLKLRMLCFPDDGDELPPDLLTDSAFAQLEQVTTPLHERGLYLLDAREYPVRAAVVLGDLATAHTVIFHVPGTTTTVDLRLFREATWMSALREEAARVSGEANGGLDGIAVIDWIGYQAPNDVATRRTLGNSSIRWVVPGEAVDDRYAREAAPLLISAVEGVRALVGPDVRIVGSGHSYGASVFGLALQETEVVDALMVMGCPGLFTDDVSDLYVPEGQVFASLAAGDVVSRLGVFGPDVTKMKGVRLVAPVPHLASYPDGGRAFTKPNVGHESYFDRGSALLHDLASVAVGVDVPSRWPSWAT